MVCCKQRCRADRRSPSGQSRRLASLLRSRHDLHADDRLPLRRLKSRRNDPSTAASIGAAYVSCQIQLPPLQKKTLESILLSIADGLNIGGVKYDETRLGGPKGDVTQFMPGVMQWDSGKHGGGVGWITVSGTLNPRTDHQVWPTSVRSDIVAEDTTPSISFPADAVPHSLVLRISSLPFLQLDQKSWLSDVEEMPGLRVELGGNIARSASRTLRFDKTTTQHDAKYYELTFGLTGMQKEEKAELALRCEKTSPSEHPLRW
jgi:hypothetical protein